MILSIEMDRLRSYLQCVLYQAKLAVNDFKMMQEDLSILLIRFQPTFTAY